MRYQVKALREPNRVVYFDIEADNEADARTLAGRAGDVVLTLKPAGSALRWGRRHKFQLLLFSQELFALLTSGLSLVEGIETIAEKEHYPESRRVLDGVLAKLRQGLSLSSALEAFPAEFPALYVATVRASERTGELHEALRRYIAYRVQADAVRSKIISASIYPMVLLVVGAMVAMFLMFFVVPRFGRIYDDIRGELPLMSRLLLEWGKLLETHAVWLWLSGLALLAGIFYLAVSPEARNRVLSKLLLIPTLQERFRQFQLARFYRAQGLLLNGGIPVLQALEMASSLLDSRLRGQLSVAAGKIREGMSYSRAMQENGLTTSVSARLLRVGERSGHMGEMMERIAEFYDADIARWVEWGTRLFEPALMAVIGVLIGGIVILMYMPIFELAGSIQ